MATRVDEQETAKVDGRDVCVCVGAGKGIAKERVIIHMAQFSASFISFRSTIGETSERKGVIMRRGCTEVMFA